MANALILQSDFGLSDGAVSAMYGVAYDVDENLKIFNLTHDIKPFDIWEASYRLIQTVQYWKPGTVFVSVVDPGVGSKRKSVAVKTSQGQYIITPDNGTLTHVKKRIGIEEAREIDETKHRLPNSGESYTFHGRDIYAYSAAKLASGKITFEEIGPTIPVEDIVEMATIAPTCDNETIHGTIDVLDIRFGSIWTNIPRTMFKELGFAFGDMVQVTIEHEHRIVYKNMMVYGRSFADVSTGETLVYTNSLDMMAIAINQGSFAKAYNVETGIGWMVTLSKA